MAVLPTNPWVGVRRSSMASAPACHSVGPGLDSLPGLVVRKNKMPVFERKRGLKRTGFV